ncbi:class I adenylate-forming enzyme family protein [Streptomyces spiralis]|uniref:class I adenylate-forming enzyme family protein n=1 Tax=Streptomyces spiralis TaxID=66376 RepID=UPI0033E01714
MTATHTHSPFGNYGFSVLTAQALRAPDAVALAHGGERLTYAELNSRVNRRAAVLQARGIDRGRRVACLLHAPLGITEVYLAAAKTGAVLAALNPYWTDDVLVTIAERSGCTALVYDAASEELIRRVRPALPNVTQWLRVGGPGESGVDVDFDQESAAAPDAEPEPGAFADDPLALFFTSGTTGLPKAVLHTHAGALSMAQLWLDVPKGPDPVFGTGPIIWGVGFVAIAGPALYGGMRLVLEDDFGPSAFLKAVPRERITHISVIPSFFTELLRHDEHAGADLSSLRVILLGGEPVLPSVLARIQERLPQAQVFSYYGQTEAPYSVVGSPGTDRNTRAVGRARTACAVKVVDAAGNRLVGEVGEIWLTGPHLMRGYDGLPEKTAEVLRDGWYVGGDLGAVDEQGALTVLGRRQDAVFRDGHFVLPGEVEEAALSIPGIAEAGAVAVPEDGQDQQILLAVLPAPGHDLDEHQVRAALAERLPEHSCPDVVVVADELPHSQDASGGQGKLLRREIRARWADRVGTPGS